jgi:hypothetical protein
VKRRERACTDEVAREREQVRRRACIHGERLVLELGEGEEVERALREGGPGLRRQRAVREEAAREDPERARIPESDDEVLVPVFRRSSERGATFACEDGEVSTVRGRALEVLDEGGSERVHRRIFEARDKPFTLERFAGTMDPEVLDRWFAETKRVLEEGYLRHDDPIRQSGFGGGPDRWRAEREPIHEAIDRDGDLLDVGCANGYLLECLVAWARERGHAIVPYGVDFSEKFVEIARMRMPQYASRFWVANAWHWTPPRRFRFVYAVLDSVPDDFMGAYAKRLLDRTVERGGRLIVGHYGSVHRKEEPIDVATLLDSAGLKVSGTASGGEPAITRFAWTDRG